MRRSRDVGRVLESRVAVTSSGSSSGAEIPRVRLAPASNVAPSADRRIEAKPVDSQRLRKGVVPINEARLALGGRRTEKNRCSSYLMS